MTDIVLATLNARYTHAAFGLRYLMANLGPLQARAQLLEFNINQTVDEIVEAIVRCQPRVVGLGVYIWNVGMTGQVVGILKRLLPDVRIVLGGPEVSHEIDAQEITAACDHVITGEGDISFRNLCERLLAGESGGRDSDPPHVIRGELPNLDELVLPYALYSSEDLAHRVIYVEASRGCPYECQFCLSALDERVRRFPVERFLAAMSELLARGARHFKFVDRTFNLHIATSTAILRFFLEHYVEGLFLHFEMVPDRLPEELRGLLGRFPAGSVQLEVGVQTFNEEVAARIGRRQDSIRLEDNFRYLRAHTGAHLHADLIVGLPGESLDSFASGFDRLWALLPHEIQVGILKRLRGAPIARHDAEFAMVYSPYAPYEILSTASVDYPTMQRLKRFAKVWDFVANRGHFAPETVALLWHATTPFAGFAEFAEWLHDTTGQSCGMSLDRITELLLTFIVERRGLRRQEIAPRLLADYQRDGRRRVPAFLADVALEEKAARRRSISADPRATTAAAANLPPRQARRVAE